ncbi:MAG: isopentenyl-diphosphate Delta-isomerase, partial [Gammaproteobacteria bacterium]|nr:isopentenyl-diphosphate Delta-isomerase [Gammaproteobacteria bacterium]
MNAPVNLVLVDAEDREIGVAEKFQCHEGDGLLHRAFSVFVYGPDGRVLLQQRSAAKPLWPMYWSNACCGHPLPGEAVPAAAERRTREELGISLKARFLYKFIYQARYSAGYSEHELCHVFQSDYDGELAPDPAEIAAWR